MNQSNKTLKLEDFNNKSLDEIIELYRIGYILEDSSQLSPQFSIQNLQLSTSTLANIGMVFTAGLVAGMITLLLVKKYQK